MSSLLYRAGIDIGGTFTDIALLSSEGQLFKKKVSSTPHDYSQGIVIGLAELLAEIGAEANNVVQLVHATTVATNAILEGKGAKTALITTKGFRDILEIGRLRIPTLYNLNYTKPHALVKRRHRIEITERTLANGEIEVPLAETEIEDIVDIIKTEDIEAVAICLLHAYKNPKHEKKLYDALHKPLGDKIYISASHQILPEIREYERTSTTVVNSYLGPIVKHYLGSLTSQLEAIGINCPIHIVQSNGGLLTVDTAIQKPACIIESGPAAGVIAGAHAAKLGNYQDIITVDMGGTTAKAAIIENGEPVITTEYEVGAGINVSSKLVKGGGYAVKLPFIDVSEIGAGGGSLVSLDVGGLLKVGPESAGSVPGPVCYDAGNDIPTLTDSFLSLGYLNPNHIAGGRVVLNTPKALATLEEKIASPLKLTRHESALGVQAIATASMSRAVKAVSTYRGRDPREFTMFAFGGNGPMIALAIAKHMGMKRVVIPSSPGIFSALGMLFSEVEYEYLQSDLRILTTADAETFETSFRELKRRAEDALQKDGYKEDEATMEYFVDLRYEGQAYELTVPLVQENSSYSIERAMKQFHAEHQRTYGHASPENPVELVSYRVKVRASSRAFTAYSPSIQREDMKIEKSTRRACFDLSGEQITVPVLTRQHILGKTMEGPIIVEEYDSTCVIPPGCSVTIDEFCNLVITVED